MVIFWHAERSLSTRRCSPQAKGLAGTSSSEQINNLFGDSLIATSRRNTHCRSAFSNDRCTILRGGVEKRNRLSTMNRSFVQVLRISPQGLWRVDSLDVVPQWTRTLINSSSKAALISYSKQGSFQFSNFKSDSL